MSSSNTIKVSWHQGFKRLTAIALTLLCTITPASYVAAADKNGSGCWKKSATPTTTAFRIHTYKDSGQIYPHTISYTGNGVTAGIFEVDFLRQSRSDVPTSYASAFLVKTNYRINEIQAKINAPGS